MMPTGYNTGSARTDDQSHLRSPLRADGLFLTSPKSRPHSHNSQGANSERASSHVLHDVDGYALSDAGADAMGSISVLSSGSQSPSRSSPAPIVPRMPSNRASGKHRSSLMLARAGSKEKTMDSRRQSTRGSPRPRSQTQTISERIGADAWDRSDNMEAPISLQNHDHAHEAMRRRSTLDDSRRESHTKPAPQEHEPLSPETYNSTRSITALPHLSNDNTGRPTRETYSKPLTELYAISYLILFSILGTLARLSLQALTFYPGAPITFSELWANVGGSLLMGFLSEDRRLFQDEWGHGGQQTASSPRREALLRDEEKAFEEHNRELKASHAKVKKTIPLFIGLATGFCGSFTSFSSFIRDAFLAFINELSAPSYHPSSAGTRTTSTTARNPGYNLAAGLAVLILTLALSLSALQLGIHIALALDRVTPTLPFRLIRRALDPLSVLLALAAWLASILLCVYPPHHTSNYRGQALFALALAPPGALLRFYISLLLNPLIPSFPLGTFFVNIFGTAVLGMAFDLQRIGIGRAAVPGGGVLGCQVLQGVMDGFCGCLTTVSTWVSEMKGLRTRAAYAYAVASVVVGVGMAVVVMGSVRWSAGWSEPACVTTW